MSLRCINSIHISHQAQRALTCSERASEATRRNSIERTRRQISLRGCGAIPLASLVIDCATVLQRGAKFRDSAAAIPSPAAAAAGASL